MRILTAHTIHVATACYVMHKRAQRTKSFHIELPWMVGEPSFIWIDDFLYLFLTNCDKINKKINVRSLKFFQFFNPCDIKFRQLAAVRVCKFCRLKIRLTLRDVTS